MSEEAPNSINRSAADTGPKGTVISIDRSKPFFVKGANQEWEKGGATEFVLRGQDERSLELKEIDASKVTFESFVFGDEYLDHMNSGGAVRLDAQVLKTLAEGKNIPDSWIDAAQDGYIVFAGSDIEFLPTGFHYAAALYRSNGSWQEKMLVRGVDTIDTGANCKSAVLPANLKTQ